ncbi:serine/threonine protein kinase [Akkermansiaceae bacterium]|nr:serine/threonine protein kinase [Akkermansiaceae bacterium]
MTGEPIPELSEQTLAGFFREALRAGNRAPRPTPPEWLQDDDFPYVVGRFVGRGGSGMVWKAEGRGGGGTVALKLVSFRGDRRIRLRWENECDALSRVDHPNLVKLIDFGLAPDLDAGWVTLEWIEGSDLATVLGDRGSLPVAEAVEFTKQIVAALSALHGAGLLHRDIKPGNILFEESSKRWVLADFGLAYDLGQDAEARVTRTLETPATPGYAAPERDQPGGHSDTRGDQYSLAFTIWEMLAGSRPAGSFPMLHTLCRCPVGVDHVLRKALSTHPKDRYSDLRGFERAFLRAVRRPPWIRPLLLVISLAAITAILYLGLRPEPFPREFHSGPLTVTEGREHYMEIDLTLEESGEFLAVVHTRSGDPFFGFTGKARLIWRDGDGNVLKTQDSNPLGVNGRFIPGTPHERIDYWSDSLPPEMATKVERVDFRANPGGISKEARDKANIEGAKKDLQKAKEGLGKAWESLRAE